MNGITNVLITVIATPFGIWVGFFLSLAIGFLQCLVLAVPLYFLWGGLGPVYFPELPPEWLHPPYWDVVWGIFTLHILVALTGRGFAPAVGKALAKN